MTEHSNHTAFDLSPVAARPVLALLVAASAALLGLWLRTGSREVNRHPVADDESARRAHVPDTDLLLGGLVSNKPAPVESDDAEFDEDEAAE